MPELHVIEHPLITHKMTHMRKKQTSTGQFRALMHEVSMLLAYEVTRDFPLITMPIETPLAPMKAKVLDGKKIVIISILRAGDGILDGMLAILPSARVGHVGIYRDPKTLVAVEYYFKMPPHMNRRDAIIVDPMLATGHSAIAAVERVKETSPRSIKFVCLLASSDGIDAFQEQHPDVPVYTAAVDEKLNDKGYILPGLGDAGDRLFGTR
jgi:uracil phosphoribosyltransferase